MKERQLYYSQKEQIQSDHTRFFPSPLLERFRHFRLIFDSFSTHFLLSFFFPRVKFAFQEENLMTKMEILFTLP